MKSTARGEIKLDTDRLWDRSYYISTWWDTTRRRVRSKRNYNKSSRLALILRGLRQTGAMVTSIGYNKQNTICTIKYESLAR